METPFKVELIVPRKDLIDVTNFVRSIRFGLSKVTGENKRIEGSMIVYNEMADYFKEILPSAPNQFMEPVCIIVTSKNDNTTDILVDVNLNQIFPFVIPTYTALDLRILHAFRIGKTLTSNN